MAALREFAADLGLAVTVTEDPADFTPATLTSCAAVVFLNSIGDVLDPPARSALTGYLRGGGAFLGVHAAAATEPGWPYFRRLVGARFTRHPEVQPALVRVVDPADPATAALDPGLRAGGWARTDEWYDFDARPEGVRVLLSVDESSYTGGGMGPDHPIAWAHEVDGARCLYTAMGHTVEAYAEPAFRTHLRGALAHVTGLA